MTAANFPAVLAFTLTEEGGWSDNPDDPGGMTNKGITLRTLQLFQHGATADDLRSISNDLAATIYRRQYWSIMGCDAMPSGIDAMVFDFGVNAGPGRSVGYLQVVAGVARDGIDGAITTAAVAKLSPTNVISKLAGMQFAHYRALPTFDEFGGGWTARTERRTRLALSLLTTGAPPDTAANDTQKDQTV